MDEYREESEDLPEMEIKYEEEDEFEKLFHRFKEREKEQIVTTLLVHNNTELCPRTDQYISRVRDKGV